ncbi:zinc finger protein ZPR1-like protein [Corchorus olitorius]|uniref:Zinc finger protein ZPR1-like protein n=1 Tax=Corchorus olitorius TaxID=93759 RepID=A0A1R3L1K1_9ROSI|nr:zinc finger protein ZPR1-like protein [Corchorus olitorius]
MPASGDGRLARSARTFWLLCAATAPGLAGAGEGTRGVDAGSGGLCGRACARVGHRGARAASHGACGSIRRKRRGCVVSGSGAQSDRVAGVAAVSVAADAGRHPERSS